MIKGVKLTAAFLTVGAFVSLGYAAVAQQSPTTTDQTTQRTANLNAQDRQFLIQAAQGGMAEVRLGQLAAQRAVNASVKQYGQHMVQQHTQANNELMQLAAQKGVTLPNDVNAQQKAMRARLGQIPGRRFDTTYIREAGVKAHTQQRDLFQREISYGQDPDVKAFAARVLPTVRDHLQMASSMAGNTALRNR